MHPLPGCPGFLPDRLLEDPFGWPNLQHERRKIIAT
jgi:hypothetical protein